MRDYYDKEKIIKYLEKYDKLQYFSDEIINKMKIELYEADEFAFLAGEEARAMRFLVEGTILVTQFSESGAEAIVCLVKPFNTCGDLEIPLSMDLVEYNVQTKSKCVFVSISKEAIHKEMKNNPIIYKMFTEELAQKLKISGNNIAFMSTHTLEERYNDIIASLGDEPEILDNLTQKEIAKLLGVSDRQLRRVISKIKEEIKL